MAIRSNVAGRVAGISVALCFLCSVVILLAGAIEGDPRRYFMPGEPYLTCKNYADVDSSTYAELYARLPGDYNESSVRHFGIGKADLDEEQRALNSLRQWTGTVKDHCVRLAYSNNIDYYQHQLNKAYNALQIKKETDRVDATLPKPPDMSNAIQ